MRKPGMSLAELLVATGIASLLTLVLVFLFMHGRTLFQGESSRSEEMREIGKGMHALSDRLSHGSVYVVGPFEALLSEKGSKELELERFLKGYSGHQITRYLLIQNQLVERVYQPGGILTLKHDFEKPESETVVARRVKSVRFRLNPKRDLEVTLEADHFALQTEFPHVRIPEAGQR